jgi:hypothetical protein
MHIRNFVFLAVGLVVGGAAILLLRCEKVAGLEETLEKLKAKATAGLVDGKYLVVQGPSGHWIYEAGGANGLKLVGQEVSPEGLHALWELQSDYQPKSMLSGAEEIIYLPYTRYSTDTRSFQVVHKFYSKQDGKLVEVPMESIPEAK